MAKQTVILTGDKELTRLLNALERKTARKLHRTASRNAAKLVMARAKAIVPRKTGRFAKALTVRAMKRSRSRMGYQVVQRENYARQGKDRPHFYGVYLELGWTARGRAANKGDLFGKQSQNLIGPQKIQGKWRLRQAGEQVERQAVELYRQELAQLIQAEG